MKMNSVKLHSFDTRQVMKKETFEIFHYSDYKISGVPFHHHDFYEMYYYIKGPARYQFRIESRVYQMQPGSVLLTGPMELHQPLPAQDEEDYERIVLWINSAYLHSLSAGDVFLGKCYDDTAACHSHLILPSLRMQARISYLLNRLLTESDNSEFGSDMYAECILRELMIELSRLPAEDRVPPHQADEPGEMISSALDYINLHYAENLTLDRLSQKLYVSKYYLAHEFKASIGISLYRFIMLKRLMNAGQLLSEGVMPSEVSKACGFNSYSSFYRAFIEEYGTSPGSYAQMLS